MRSHFEYSLSSLDCFFNFVVRYVLVVLLFHETCLRVPVINVHNVSEVEVSTSCFVFYVFAAIKMYVFVDGYSECSQCVCSKNLKKHHVFQSNKKVHCLVCP